MGIQRFRSVEDMPTPEREPDPNRRLERMRFVFSALAFAPDDRPRGVQMFASLDEADAARKEHLRKRMNRQRRLT